SAKEKIVRLSYALSSPVRVDMLRIISNTPCSISKLATECFLSISSTNFHTKILAEAGLISIDYKPNKKGNIRICSPLPFQTLICSDDWGATEYLKRIVTLDSYHEND